MFPLAADKQATFTWSSEQRVGAPAGEDWESETWGGLFSFFFFCSFFWSPSWHRNGLVGRKKESGEKTNDEKVYSPRAFIKYMEGTREAHLDSIGVPLMASSVLFPDQGAGSYGMSMAARTPAI